MTFYRTTLRLCLLVTMICAVLGLSSSARAECLQTCFASHGCKDTQHQASAACQSYISSCVAQCTTTSKFVFGAIAYDADTTAWGLADDSATADDASKSALSYCSQHGTNCAVVTGVSNGCAAIAANEAGNVNWAVDTLVDDAQSRALALCLAKSDGKCEIEMAHCYYP